jgi:uncharacterized protein YodC (DUF2158 family)
MQFEITATQSARIASNRYHRALFSENTHMSHVFNVGDTVQLKSGGPRMTVTGIGDHHGVMSVWCDWFIASKKETDVFPIDALKAVGDLKPVNVRRPRSWIDARRGR